MNTDKATYLGRQKANAALIVKAVNEYDAAVAEAAQSLRWGHRLISEHNHSAEDNAIYTQNLSRCETLLDKALSALATLRSKEGK